MWSLRSWVRFPSPAPKIKTLLRFDFWVGYLREEYRGGRHLTDLPDGQDHRSVSGDVSHSYTKLKPKSVAFVFFGRVFAERKQILAEFTFRCGK